MAKKWNVEVPLKQPDAQGNNVEVIATFKTKKEAKEFAANQWGADNGKFQMVQPEDA